jgi:hypothetical protein
MFRFTLIGDDFKVQADAMGRDLAKAVTIAVGAAAEGLKLDLRKQLTARGGFGRFANAIRSSQFPKRGRYSPKAAGTVWAAGKESRGADNHATVSEIFDAFAVGATVTPTGGRYLAIPLHNFRGADRRRVGPESSFFKDRLFFVPSDSGKGTVGILATRKEEGLRRTAKNSARSTIGQRVGRDLVPQFILVSSVRMPKLLTPEALAEKWAGNIPDLIEQSLTALGRK